MSRASVVELNSKLEKKATAKDQQNTTSERLLNDLHSQAQSRLGQLLATLFDNTDDALFELADRSHSDGDQQLYFESMRHLRLSRASILERFRSSLREAFTAISRPEAETTGEPEEPDFDEVALVQQDDLEISVAVSGIVSKVTSQHSLAIMQLTKRLDHITRQRSITEKNNPLGPQQLSECFATALQVVDLDIRIRIILLKLFERFVMEELAELYQDANARLVEAGVLPKLKHPYRDNRPRRGYPPGGASQRGGNATDAEHGAYSGSGGGYGGAGTGAEFGVIQRLLARSEGRAGASAEHSHGPMLSTEALVDVLSQLQVSAQPRHDGPPAAVDLSSVLSGQARKVTGDQAAGLHQADEDVVNFVGMLFDYILNDRNLAIPMKALIARLQIPIVKLAILDKAFFEQAGHPARRLLNELSSAGIGWSSASELKRDALYNMIESVVARVLNDFQGDTSLFDTLTQELVSFVSRERRKSDIVEQRVRETEQGKAKTADAKLRAQNVINQKAAGLRLHPLVGRFVSDTWSKVLVYIAVKHGNEAQIWTDAVQDLDTLLWSIQPLNTLADVEAREQGCVLLLERLASGMRLINVADDEIDETIRSLQLHLAEISEHDRSYLQDDCEPPPPNQEEEREVIKEVKLAEPIIEEAVDTLPEPAQLDAVDNLSEGAWLELGDDDADEEPLRCKLATIVGSGTRFVFVNRRGMKVAERSRIQLGVGLGNGQITVLDESEVFDKALEAVIGNLRHLRAQPTRIDG